MKKIKIIFLMVLVLVISGCKIRSNVAVLPDGTTIEKVTITQTTKESSFSQKEFSDIIDAELENFETLIRYGDYKYKKVIDKKYFGVDVEKKYENICLYFQETLFNQYIYRHISCKEDEKFIVIANDTPILEETIEGSVSNPLDLSDVQLSITLPTKAAESNADIEKENTYTWEFDNTPSGKNIYLKINKDDMQQANLHNQNTIKRNKILRIIATIIAVLFIGYNVYKGVLKFYKKYQENRIEY